VNAKEAIGDAIRLLVAFAIAFFVDKPVQDFVNQFSDSKSPSDPLHVATFITAFLGTILLWVALRLIGGRPTAQVVWTDLRDMQRVDDRSIRINSAKGSAGVILDFKLEPYATSLFGLGFLYFASLWKHLRLTIEFSEKLRLTRESTIVAVDGRTRAVTELPAYSLVADSDWVSERITVTALDATANFRAPITYALEYKGKKRFVLRYVRLFSSVQTIHLKEDR
jgi:hypothetical protein